jgi:hypothetical protein
VLEVFVMSQVNATPLFPKPVTFPDVDEATLAREENEIQSRTLMSGGAWRNYLRKTLPPLQQQTDRCPDEDGTLPR